MAYLSVNQSHKDASSSVWRKIFFFNLQQMNNRGLLLKCYFYIKSGVSSIKLNFYFYLYHDFSLDWKFEIKNKVICWKIVIIKTLQCSHYMEGMIITGI